MRRYLGSFVLLLAAIVSLTTFTLPAFAAKTVYVNGATGNDGNSGLSWETAKATVTAGLGIAVSGDEVWVARGVYYVNITLTLGVKL